MGFFQPNTLWRDEQYYLNKETGELMPKYVLILAVSDDGDDALSAVLTSKPNGLREEPACDLGPPRAGFFLGVPGGVLGQPTWVDFSSAEDQEAWTFQKRIKSGRVNSTNVTLDMRLYCNVLRCLRQSEDLAKKQHRWLADTLQLVGCPG